MHLPQIKQGKLSTQITDKFYGYNNSHRVADGEFTELINFNPDEFPVLKTRNEKYMIKPKSGTVTKLGNCKGFAYCNGLVYTDNVISGGNTACHLYLDDTDLYNANTFSLNTQTEKQIVAMGSYIIVFPDMKYVNTLNPATDSGRINVNFENSSNVKIQLCTDSGSLYQKSDSSAARYVTVAASAPSSPKDGARWLDTSLSTPELKKWYRAGEEWVTIKSYVRFYYSSIGTDFSKGDDVDLSFSGVADTKITALAGTRRIVKRTSSYLVFEGAIDDTEKTVTNTHGVAINRTAPVMDYIIECSNRLWGCRHGANADGKTVNEIYCSKLGDFKNWKSFDGISTDSWSSAVGSDGAFTGAAVYEGHPVFFKEKYIHKIYVSSEGAHQIVTSDCVGVQNGCDKSVARVDGILYYKGIDGVYAYDGASSVKISEALGNVKYYSAVGGSYSQKYYIGMYDGEQEYSLFIYDTTKKLWYKEYHASDYSDGIIKYMAQKDGELYCVDTDNRMWCLTGVPEGFTYSDTYTDTVDWIAQTGYFGYEYSGKKYISRLSLRMYLAQGATAAVYIGYDNDDGFSVQGSLTGNGNDTLVFPFVPRRCDRMRLRLEGTGECIIYSISKTIEQVSEL